MKVNVSNNKLFCSESSAKSSFIVSVLRHEDFIVFSRDVDASLQRVSCIFLSIDEDLIYSPGREYLLQFEVVESTDRFEGPTQVIVQIIENGEDVYVISMHTILVFICGKFVFICSYLKQRKRNSNVIK